MALADHIGFQKWVVTVLDRAGSNGARKPRNIKPESAAEGSQSVHSFLFAYIHILDPLYDTSG